MNDELVSIIIPNYNCAQYIEEALNSIYQQKYYNFEIIIIDDGSTDNSVEIIKKYMKNHKNITLIKQNHMNAAIARNRALEGAKGKYVYFLDADDVILENGLNSLINTINQNDVDLIIGNYIKTDENGNSVHIECKSYETFQNSDVMELAKLSPVPSNKMYRLEIIRKYSITFTNSNIGQDLGFFLKYLACCNRVETIDNDIYMHRIINRGMTKEVSFKIFDITRVFEEVYNFYKKNNKEDFIKEYLEIVKFEHLFWQMNKQIKFTTYKERRIVVDYFCYYINQININDKITVPNIKRDIKIYKLNNAFKTLTSSKLYSILFNKILEKTHKIF